jgi:hypothetical protein
MDGLAAQRTINRPLPVLAIGRSADKLKGHRSDRGAEARDRCTGSWSGPFIVSGFVAVNVQAGFG